MVNVSRDALKKVSVALKDYRTDIAGFSKKIEDLSADVSKSADSEMKRIAKQIEDAENEVKRLDAKVKQLAETIDRKSNEERTAKQDLNVKKTQLAEAQREADLLVEQIARLEAMYAEAERRRDAEAQNDPSTLSQTAHAFGAGFNSPGGRAQATALGATALSPFLPGGRRSPPRDAEGVDTLAGIIQGTANAAPVLARGSLESVGRTIRHSRSLATELENKPDLHQLLRRLDQVKSEIEHLQDEILGLDKRISQLRQEIDEVRVEKGQKENELTAAKKRLGKLEAKRENMKMALAKLNDNMNTMLSASKSFETKAASETDKSTSGINKCIAAIDAYLA